MPKRNKRGTVADRITRRANQHDPRRLELLEKILDESSSISLNDEIHQQSAREALNSHTRLLELVEELRHVESSNNPELPSRSDQCWKEFFEWVDTESGNETGLKLSETIGVARHEGDSVDSQEYALITKIPVEKGSNIFIVHNKIALSTETATKDADLYDFIKNDSIASGMQNVVLVLHLLNEYSKKEKSYWYPYLSILPRKILPVLTLNKDKLNYLLVSSHIFDALKLIRAIARQYSYFFKRLQSTNLPLVENFTFEYYSWGVSLVCSRQNHVRPLESKNHSSFVGHALIPVLDMCNHDRKANQAIYTGYQSLLTASHSLKVNEEVTLNYGIRSSGDFYIHNGFVPEEVPFDVMPFSMMLDKQEPLFEAKAKLLEMLKMPPFGRFRLTFNDFENRHKRDPHLTMFLIVFFLSGQELEYISNSDNSVGVADEIYEFVQYSDSKAIKVSSNEDKREILPYQVKDFDILAVKERLLKCVKEYLSKRASIGVAFIDRAFRLNELLDKYMSKMLSNEKSIYESYIIKST